MFSRHAVRNLAVVGEGKNGGEPELLLGEVERNRGKVIRLPRQKLLEGA